MRWARQLHDTPAQVGGCGLTPGWTSVLFIGLIAVLVTYTTVTNVDQADIDEAAGSDAPEPDEETMKPKRRYLAEQVVLPADEEAGYASQVAAEGEGDSSMEERLRKARERLAVLKAEAAARNVRLPALLGGHSRGGDDK